jgi:hypothetical protein
MVDNEALCKDKLSVVQANRDYKNWGLINVFTRRTNLNHQNKWIKFKFGRGDNRLVGKYLIERSIDSNNTSFWREDLHFQIEFF